MLLVALHLTVSLTWKDIRTCCQSNHSTRRDLHGRLDRAHGRDLSAGGHRHRASRVSRSGQRQPDLRRRTSSVGSALIGQPFDDPKYFWSRPSATARCPTTRPSSSGSNLGPTNPNLVDAVKSAHRRAQAGRSRQRQARFPSTWSRPRPAGSTRTSARPRPSIRSPRVAKARGLDEKVVRELVAEHTRGRTLGLLGEAAGECGRIESRLGYD